MPVPATELAGWINPDFLAWCSFLLPGREAVCESEPLLRGAASAELEAQRRALSPRPLPLAAGALHPLAQAEREGSGFLY